MDSNKFSYRLSNAAESDIDEIITYIAEDLGNPDAAQSFIDEMIKRIEDLCEMPRIGNIVENDLIHRNNIRRILVHNHILYYFIDDQNRIINVMRVVYNRRDQFVILSSMMSDDLNH